MTVGWNQRVPIHLPLAVLPKLILPFQRTSAALIEIDCDSEVEEISRPISTPVEGFAQQGVSCVADGTIAFDDFQRRRIVEETNALAKVDTVAITDDVQQQPDVLCAMEPATIYEVPQDYLSGVEAPTVVGMKRRFEGEALSQVRATTKNY